MTNGKRGLALCLLCAALLTGCGSVERGTASSAPEGVSADASGQPQGRPAVPLELPQGEVLEETAVEYTWDYPVTVDGGRQLTARDAMTHITNYYAYDEYNTLQLVDTDSATPEMG